MSRLSVFVFAFLFLVCAQAQAATPKAKKTAVPVLKSFACPAAISNPIHEEYIKVPANVRCIAEKVPSSKAKLRESAICDVGDESSLDTFDVGGSGSIGAETPTFWVTTKPRVFVYSYAGGPGGQSIKMTMHDAITKKAVASYVTASAAVDGTKTYVNMPGHFFFTLDFPQGAGEWEIELLSPDED